MVSNRVWSKRNHPSSFRSALLANRTSPAPDLLPLRRAGFRAGGAPVESEVVRGSLHPALATRQEPRGRTEVPLWLARLSKGKPSKKATPSNTSNKGFNKELAQKQQKALHTKMRETCALRLCCGLRLNPAEKPGSKQIGCRMNSERPP